MTPEIYNHLADLTVAAHWAYVQFVICGQILILAGWARGWMWPRNFVFRALHLAAIGLVVIQAWLGLWCPLTLLEHHLREKAGEGGVQMSFIGRWLNESLFFEAPGWVFVLCYSAFGLLVAVSFFKYPPRRRHQCEAGA
ncbi:MAG: DUF2784 domain-containing protein [Chloroflexi bacterium]|nr:DUF2784 domain-containing protein [Chloroflexota bacterium]